MTLIWATCYGFQLVFILFIVILDIFIFSIQT
jgi:hypothetical protein